MEKKTISYSKYVFGWKNLALLAVLLIIAIPAIYTGYTWVAIFMGAIAALWIGIDSYQWYNEKLGNPNR